MLLIPGTAAVLVTVTGLVTLAQTPSASSSQQAEPSHATTQSNNRALGVSCEHCHTTDRWLDDAKPQFRTAQGMARMVVALNGGALKGIGEVSCWTCHRGDVRPSRVPRPMMDAELAKWPVELASAPESVKLAMAVYNVTLGVSCDHCHTADWKQYDKAPMKLVRTMNSMFSEFPKYMPATARTQCYMCHKGSTKPELREASTRVQEIKRQ